MKDDKKFCILKVSYSILEGEDETTGTVNTTEMEHIFVAKKKSAVLKKIERFEDRLRKKKEQSKGNLLERFNGVFKKYLDRYRYSYETLLRL